MRHFLVNKYQVQDPFNDNPLMLKDASEKNWYWIPTTPVGTPLRDPILSEMSTPVSSLGEQDLAILKVLNKELLEELALSSSEMPSQTQ